jgi:hypothetical protein
MLTDLIRRRGGLVRSWEGWAFTVWVVLVAGTSLRGLIWPHIHNCYPCYAAAGRHWLAGQELYQRLADTCRYSPFIHALLAPFALLPEQWGALLWRLLGAAVYLAGLSCWMRAALPAALTRPQQAALFLLAVPLSVISLNNGQANLLMTGMILLGLGAAGAGRWNWSAAALAVACLLKVYPLALALLLVLAFPRRLAVRLGAALAVGLLLPFLMHSPDYVWRQYLRWASNLYLDDRSRWAFLSGYRDLWLLVRMSHVPLSRHGYVVVQLAAAALLAGVSLAYRFRRRPERRCLSGLFGLAACWMTLCGPATESCTYIILAPTFAWCLVASWQGGHSVWVRRLTVGSYGLFLAEPLLQFLPFDARLAAMAIQPLGALILFGTLLWVECRTLCGRAPAEDAAAAPRSVARAA